MSSIEYIHAQHAHMCMSMCFIVNRKAQRIVHVPFFEPVPVEDESRQIRIEDSYHTCRKASSSTIGFIIGLKDHLLSSRNRSYIGQFLLPFVTSHMPNVHHRTKKSYALVLLAAKLVSHR